MFQRRQPHIYNNVSYTHPFTRSTQDWVPATTTHRRQNPPSNNTWWQKTGTLEMRNGSHVQLAALRNRDLEQQTASPFSNHWSVERSTSCCRHKNVLHFWISSISISKVPVFLCHLVRRSWDSTPKHHSDNPPWL
jgi:hypothetical protein